MADEVMGQTPISGLEGLTELQDSGDILYIVDADGSSKKIQATDLFWQMANFNGSHNGIYRGKYLGDAVTDEQWAEIKAGTFKDMFIGDYWTINGINFVIGDFDYKIGTGDSGYECEDHHILIVPDMLYGDTYMNDSNTTTGGYVGSYMYETGLSAAKTTINNCFGSAHILKHREYLSNAVTSGYPSAGAWYDSTVELMNEEMVYGCPIRQQTSYGGTGVNNATIDKSQLALFRLNKQAIIARGTAANGKDIGGRYTWWLRDIYSATGFCCVNYDGNATGSNASGTYGVRPAFCIYAS